MKSDMLYSDTLASHTSHSSIAVFSPDAARVLRQTHPRLAQSAVVVHSLQHGEFKEEVKFKQPETTPDPPISPFKHKQNILFQILSARTEDWREKTFCARILLKNGAQMEVQATKAALDQWKNLPKYVVHTAEINRSVLKPYQGAVLSFVHFWTWAGLIAIGRCRL